MELVGDDNDTLAHLGQLAHGGQQLPDLLRRQHGRGLVEDNNVCVLVEDLQNLHPLLQSHRAVGYPQVRVNVQAVLFAKRLRNAHGGLPVKEDAVLAGLPAIDDVLSHGAGAQQHEVLLHHADLLGNGVVGRAEVLQLAVEIDLTGGGALQSIEDFHQGGFACAVFADNRQDLSFFQGEMNVVVGAQRAVYLGDVLHFQQQWNHQSFHCDLVCAVSPAGGSLPSGRQRKRKKQTGRDASSRLLLRVHSESP